MKAPVSRNLRQAVGVLTTGAAVLVAVIGARALWIHYQVDPWTRDGRIRAEVVQIAPDVQGLVTKVYVGNDQLVHKGDVLFDIDRARYELALHEADVGVEKANAAVVRAKAAIVRANATLGEARREAVRNRGLGDLVSTEATEQSQTRVSEGEAAVAEAKAALAEAETAVNAARNGRDLAALNLQRTRVVAPLDGRLSDLGLRPGNYVAPGKPVIALVDTGSLRVEGYFEETKLPQVHIGQKAKVHLMGENRVLDGHVTSIASAIEDHDRAPSANGLPAINPNFSWVRLAQRVPVRIALDHPPADVALIPGRTATVTLDQSDKGTRQ
ncbi:MAG: HlyD family secretion protein [Sphingomonadales bacterium]|nr:HlyD family secretion protein [Sphingomonadales bacterium]MDE2171593.1 HlyD family secretion protein [Sphingomonadales bacterium]